LEPAGTFDTRWAKGKGGGARRVGDGRRLDLEVHNFARGATAYYGVDVTVVAPTKGLHKRADGRWAGLVEPGKAAEKGEDVKDARYPPGDLKAGMVLLPAAVESFGRLGDKFITLLREIAEMAHVLRRWPRWYFWDKWAPKIGACLAEGNHIKSAMLRAEYSRLRVAGAVATADDDANHWDHTIDLTGPAEAGRPNGTLRQPKRSQRRWLQQDGGGLSKTQQRALLHLRRMGEPTPDGISRRGRGAGTRGPGRRGAGSGKTRRRAARRARRLQ